MNWVTVVRKAGIVALTTTTLLSVSSTAQANVVGADSSCGGTLCLYEHDGFQGAKAEMGLATGCYNVPSAMDNKASSMKNMSGILTVRFYNIRGCTGTYDYTARPLSSDSDLTNNGFDNKTSAVRPV